MISKRGMERKSGKMELYTEETTSKAKNKAKGSSFGATTACMKETSGKTTFTAKENTHGKMEGCMKANGKVTKWMEKVSLAGLMVASTMGSTWTTKNTASVFLPLKMGECTKASGKMGNNTGGGGTRRRIWWRKESGRTEKESDGWETNKIMGQELQNSQYDSVYHYFHLS